MHLTTLVFKGKTKVLEETVSLFSSDTVKLKTLLQIARAMNMGQTSIEAIEEVKNGRT